MKKISVDILLEISEATGLLLYLSGTSMNLLRELHQSVKGSFIPPEELMDLKVLIAMRITSQEKFDPLFIQILDKILGMISNPEKDYPLFLRFMDAVVAYFSFYERRL